MSCDDVAVRLESIGKAFQIYEKPYHRLLQAIAPRLGNVVPGLGGRWSTGDFSREFWALRDVSLEVKRGDAVGIIGRNGSGKSTLLQIIAGTLSPTFGSRQVNGRVAALLELGSGFNPDFTGRENVLLNGMILGLTEREVRDRFDDIAGFADIGEFLDQPVRTYSSGMMLRLAFAVQTQVNPEILIVDEALAVGDALFQKRCFQQMEALRNNGCTLLVVSHDQESIRTLTDHALLLRDGVVRSRGASSEVVLDYRRELHEDEKSYYAAVAEKHALLARQDCAQAKAAKRSLTPVHGEPQDDAQQPVVDDGLSFGDLDCVITSVRIFDGDGTECAYFLPGDAVRIEVTATARLDLDKLNVNVRIRNKEGVKMYSWGTLNQDIASWAGGCDEPVMWSRNFAAKETFVVDFEFECRLGMNFYEVQVSVSEELDKYQGAQRMLHWRDEAAFFQVGVRPKEYTFGGVADLKMKAQVR